MPKKRFGQNFLQDQAIIAKIIDCIGVSSTDHLVEIGPGTGALTQPLSVLSKRLDLIELDRDLIPDLENQFLKKFNSIYLHQADVLTFDFESIIQNNQKLRIIGNLPYNISTPLLFYLLHFKAIIQDCLFMLQEEVVKRISAHPKTKAYGRLSVMMQYHFHATELFRVPPEAFLPSPKVNSSIIKLLPYETLPFIAKDYTVLEKLVASAFLHKRKTLKNNLSHYLTGDDWQKVGIDPTLRAEALSVSDFVGLSNWISR